MKIPLNSNILKKIKIVYIGIIIMLIMLLNIRPLSAQVLVGPKIGGRMSWASYDQFDTNEFKKSPFFGYSAGITTAFKVKKRFFLQVDLLYSRQGKKIESNNGSTLENISIFHYLNTPIIYRMDFKEALFGQEFKWYLGAGPNVNFWLKGNGKLKSVELYEINIEQLSYDVEFKDYPELPEENMLYIGSSNRVQVGLVFAGGLVFEPRPNQSILVEYRFEWGHSYFAKESGRFTDVVAYEDNLRARNHGMQFSVSYLIDLGSDGKKEKKIYYKD